MHLLTQAKNGVSSLELKRHLGVCYKTALLLKHKLMEVMRLREEPRRLTGRVEIDDAYLGGERPGGKPGRGSENKVSFLAAVENFAAKSLARPVTVVSDGLGCFSVLAGLGIVHRRIVTGGGSTSAKLPQFTAVNTLLGNRKTAINDTYHAFDFAKHAPRYLGAVQYLFNRRFDLRAILRRLLAAAVSTSPRPRRVLRVRALR
jgi:hypothetical protein